MQHEQPLNVLLGGTSLASSVAVLVVLTVFSCNTRKKLGNANENSYGEHLKGIEHHIHIINSTNKFNENI